MEPTQENAQATGEQVAPVDGNSPENVSTQEPGGEQADKPKYVTLDDLEQFGNTIVKRVTQSSKDRVAHVQGQVDQVKKQMGLIGQGEGMAAYAVVLIRDISA